MSSFRLVLVIALAGTAFGEEILHEAFEGPSREGPLARTWGDEPARVLMNATESGIGRDGSAAAHLRASFAGDAKHNLSYWSYGLREPIPLVRQLQAISFGVKATVPVSLKIAIAPYGFIYHGPGVGPFDRWSKVTLDNAYEELRKWCEGGKKPADGAWISAIIVAVGGTRGASADVIVDDIVLEGPDGAREAVAAAAVARRSRKARVAAISLVWDEGHRTLANALKALDEARAAGADLACLPEECVYQPAEPIPGPASDAIAKKAAQHKMLVVGNLRERDGEKTYATSFLCDREGKLVGKYRKSHRLPCEDGIALGDDLPVFETDIGAVGLKVGTDHYFPEIDAVLRMRGASLVVWSTSPFPIRDEHLETLTLQGRAVHNSLYIVAARYAGKANYGGYTDAFSWTGTWPVGRAQVFDPDGHTVADSGHAGGVAVATIPASRLGGAPHNGGYGTTGKYAAITAAELPPPFPREKAARRVIKAAAIECDGDINRLVAKLDACGKQGCDLVCLWEYVWYNNDTEVEKHKERNRGYLARIADAAKQHKMYVAIAGELERGFNEAIVFGRDGKELGRYTKINQTTDKKSKYYQAGDKVGLFDLDFGRICLKICADVYSPEMDRVAALHQADLMLLPTQDAGPFTDHTRIRDLSRCVDNGYFLLRAACGTRQTDHRTYIADPWGFVLAASQYGTNNEPLIVTLQLDNRPKYYEWPEAVRKAGPYPDPVIRGIKPEAFGEMYSGRNHPEAKSDLRTVLLKCRRPDLYKPRPEPKK